MPRRRASRAAFVFALLVVATIAAFAWSQRLKRDPLVLDRVSFRATPYPPRSRPIRAFTPNGDCQLDRMRIRFRTTRSDRADIQVVKPGGRLILTLARDEYLKRYTFHTYYWSGRRRDDGLAAPGRYKLRVKMRGEDRTLVPGGVMRLHRPTGGPVRGCPVGDLPVKSTGNSPEGAR